jgi:exosortase/archaeosortase family protein
MIKNLIDNIKIFFTDPRWEKVRGVFWFCLITVLIHVSWRFWANNLHYFPVNRLMMIATSFFVDQVYIQSIWCIEHVLGIKIFFTGEYTFYCENGQGLLINEGCSGIKQILQFGILMLIFPGPWKHKAWFIPLGMIIVHFTNVLRVIILTVVIKNWPAKIHEVHDSWMRIMFYVVIFALWLIWVEKIAVKKQE